MQKNPQTSPRVYLYLQQLSIGISTELMTGDSASLIIIFKLNTMAQLHSRMSRYTVQ